MGLTWYVVLDTCRWPAPAFPLLVALGFPPPRCPAEVSPEPFGASRYEVAIGGSLRPSAGTRRRDTHEKSY